MVEKVICLDIGCGSDRSYKFNPHCPVHSETILLDVESPSSLVRKFVSSRASLHFIVADACMLPIRDSTINLIYAIHIIEHVSDATRFLYEVKRILRQRGELYLEFPTIFSVDLYIDPTHKEKLHYIKIMRIAKKLGFTIVLKHRVGSMFPRPLRKVINVIVNLFEDHLQLVLKKCSN